MSKSRLTRGWRQSLRTGAWYRRRANWTAIVMADGGEYRLILKRTARTFEDVLSEANAVIDGGNRQ